MKLIRKHLGYFAFFLTIITVLVESQDDQTCRVGPQGFTGEPGNVFLTIENGLAIQKLNADQISHVKNIIKEKTEELKRYVNFGSETFIKSVVRIFK